MYSVLPLTVAAPTPELFVPGRQSGDNMTSAIALLQLIAIAPPRTIADKAIPKRVDLHFFLQPVNSETTSHFCVLWFHITLYILFIYIFLQNHYIGHNCVFTEIRDRGIFINWCSRLTPSLSMTLRRCVQTVLLDIPKVWEIHSRSFPSLV